MLRILFDDFKLVKLKEVGPSILDYPTFLVSLYNYFTKNKLTTSVKTICPQCGFRLGNDKSTLKVYKVSLFLVSQLRKILGIGWRKKRWLLALYKK